MADATILDAFLRQVEQRGDRVALRFKAEPGGDFVARTWAEIHRDVLRLVGLLDSRGIQAGDRVAQLSENRYEWLLLDLAVGYVGAVHVPLHATLSASQVEYQVQHSGSRLLFISNEEQADKVSSLNEPELRDTFSYEVVPGFNSLWDELPEPSKREPAVVAEPASTAATILYTSGTTGEPKGVILSHRNLTSNAEGTLQAFELDGSQVRLGFLPLSHIFARTCDLYIWILEGGEFAIAESRDTVVADCQKIQPTFLNGVPYFFEKVMQSLIAAGAGDAPGALRKTLGGRIRYCNSGGAPLPEHVYDFFHEREVPLLQGYGLTESSPVISCSTEKAHLRGCSGKPIPDVEVAIDNGEIVTRGPHVMLGYWQNDQATAEVIQDGWLRTGDLGELIDGFVRITGRSKELIVTSAGKNIAPMLLESLLTADENIEQVVVIGDNRKYLTALIVPSWSRLQSVLPDLASSDDPCKDSAAIDHIQRTVTKRLQRLSRHEQIGRFVLLQHPFSIERGELTAKLSLRRSVIADHYAEAISSMYEE